MKMTFHVEGLSELDEALKELPKATARNVLLRTLKDSSGPMIDAAKASAPKRKGGLIKSIDVSTKLSRRQRSMNRKESPVEVYIGPSPHPKGVQQEFGNAHHHAQSFMRPAWDGTVQIMLSSIRDKLANEIDKAVARLARKAARLAAKMKA